MTIDAQFIADLDKKIRESGDPKVINFWETIMGFKREPIQPASPKSDPPSDARQPCKME